MTHEIINAMAARTRVLRNSDESNFDTLRLVVQRSGVHHVTCSLIVERIGQHRIAGSRLAYASFNTTALLAQERTPEGLLSLAVARLR